MKKIFFLTVVMVLVISIAVSAAEYSDGHYVGFVAGSHDDTVVEVGIFGGNIVEVNIISPIKLEFAYEYEEGIKAFKEYPAKVLSNQNTDIDVVAGATSSYKTYNEAVQMALDIASGNYKGSKFYGLAKNFAHGHVLVEVTTDGKDVSEVKFITNDDGQDRATIMEPKTASYPSKPAREFFNTFGEKAVEAANAGTYEVDLISGATHSFHEYNAALRDALEQAGFDI